MIMKICKYYYVLSYYAKSTIIKAIKMIVIKSNMKRKKDR